MKKFLLFIMGILCAIICEGQVLENDQYAFEVEKLGNGPDIIFIPGATCSGEVWEETVQALSGQFTCHVVTLAGYAGVEPLSTHPILPQYKEGLMRYIKSLPTKPILVGHSIGGFIGLQLAAEHSQLLEKLVIVDALPFLVAANNPAMTEEMARSYPVESMVQQYVSMSDSAFKSMQAQVIKSMLSNKEKYETVLGWSIQSDRATMAYTMNELMTNDLRDDIASIEVPVLVLGAWDPGFPFSQEQQKETYAEQYKDIKTLDLVMADNARHFIMYDDPSWFMSQLRRFIL